MLPAGYTPSNPIACPVTGKLQCYTNVPGYVGQTVFIHPAYTYGPLERRTLHVALQHRRRSRLQGRDRAGASRRARRGSRWEASTGDFDVAGVQIKSITSWMRDAGAGNGDLTLQEPQNTTVTVSGGYNPFAQSPFIFDLGTPYSSAYFYTATPHRRSRRKCASLRAG